MTTPSGGHHAPSPDRTQGIRMYTISTTPGGRVDSAATIPDALAALASQLVDQLPHGLVAWRITDPAGIEHRGNGTLNGRLDLLAVSIEELVDELYPQLHRSVDGGPRQAHDIAARAPVLRSGPAVRGP